MLVGESIGKYFYSLDVRNHKQVVNPRSHKSADRETWSPKYLKLLDDERHCKES